MYNPGFHDIFIYNCTSGEGHSANNLTGSCNLNEGKMGNWWVVPFDSEEMLHQYIRNLANAGFPVDLCGHCFPGLSKR